MKTEDHQVVVFADARPALAYLVRDRLADAGIEAIIENEALWQGPTELLPSVIAPRVVVAEPDAAAAREIVREFLDEARHPAFSDANGSSAPAASGERSAVSVSTASTAAVAVCPQCHRPRLTVCPFCQTASAKFPPADQPPGNAEGPPGLLLCTTCDEPFEPAYLRRCEWCGHDFGDGFEIERKEAAANLNERVITMVIGLAIVLVAIFAYFMSLLK